MLSALIGLIVTVGSLWALIVWFNEFVFVMKGILPICFFFSGIIAIIAGIAGWRETKR
ncbi:MAG: hypothetical protein GF384_05430 [Elusimicrobia bacterium]|nr:hypothetical protein [Elusimicrobiota bacterium]MBD3412222.1 hypothetical protein [Elusimicrobiota bacterium]